MAIVPKGRDHIHYNICSSRDCLIGNGRHGNHTLSSSMSKEEYPSFWIDKQHKKALYEMLPLLLYPIFFLLFTMPIFGFTVYDFLTLGDNVTYEQYNTTIAVPEYNLDEPTFFVVLAPCWSFTTSLLLISHLCVVRCINKKRCHAAIQHRRRIGYYDWDHSTMSKKSY